MAKLFKRKIKWKEVGIGALAIVLVMASVGGLAALFGKQTKTIGPGDWIKGELDENGEYIESDIALVNETAFSCDGLRVEKDFKAACTYDIYYYDASGKFIGKVTPTENVYNETNPEASTCRIVIFPDIPADEKASEFKISFWEVRSFAKMLKVTVNKEQETYSAVNPLFNDDAASVSGVMTLEDGIANLDTSAASYKSTKLILTKDTYDAYRIYVKLADSEGDTFVAFADACLTGEVAGEDVNNDKIICRTNGTKVANEFAHVFDGDKMEAGVWYSVIVEAPAKADALRVSFPVDATVRIYGLTK